MTWQDRYPDVAFVTVPEPAPHLIHWHDCPDLDGDAHLADTTIRYQRFGGHHVVHVCQMCLVEELVYLYHGRPYPTFCRVETSVDPDYLGAVA